MEETQRKRVEGIVRDCVEATLATVGSTDGIVTGSLHELSTSLRALIAATVKRLEDEVQR